MKYACKLNFDLEFYTFTIDFFCLLLCVKVNVTFGNSLACVLLNNVM